MTRCLFEIGEDVWVYNLGGYPLGKGTIVEIKEDEQDIWYTIELPKSKYRLISRQSLNLLRKLNEGNGEDRIEAHPRSVPFSVHMRDMLGGWPDECKS